jgi:branched-chain amino acid transport system ATP-binding protein
MTPNQPYLEAKDLVVHYGGIRALNHISMHVNHGEIVAVIGANGAGKSTLMKTIAGIKQATSGSVMLDGKLLPKQAYQVVGNGVMLVPEGRRIFAPLSVRENLMLGAYSRSNTAEINETLENVFSMFPVLKERIHQRGGTLSGGEQQMLAIGRALMSRPGLLLLDEPSLGLAPIVVDALFQKVNQLNRETGLTILLVEQNASLALEFSGRAYVLETGEVKMEGSGRQLLEDERIKESYLGVTSTTGD